MTIRVAKNALATHGGSVEGLPGFEELKEEDRAAVVKQFTEGVSGSGRGHVRSAELPCRSCPSLCCFKYDGYDALPCLRGKASGRHGARGCWLHAPLVKVALKHHTS